MHREPEGHVRSQRACQSNPAPTPPPPRYSLRHPEHVEHLVLADPWGFSRHPDTEQAGAADKEKEAAQSTAPTPEPNQEPELEPVATTISSDTETKPAIAAANLAASDDDDEDGKPQPLRATWRRSFALRTVVKVASWFPPYAILR